MTNRMRRRTDGRKLVGRYIRSDDQRLLGSVVVSPFSFEEIRDAPVCFTDNVNANIIHHELHDENVLESAIRAHETFDEEFRSAADYKPILQPLDFTDDWERQRARMSARRDPLYDDDEEFDLEKELAAASAKKAAKAARENQERQVEKNEEEVTAHAPVTPGQLSSLTASNETHDDQPQQSGMSMDDVGREIQKFADVEMPSDGSVLAEIREAGEQEANISSETVNDEKHSPQEIAEDDPFIAMPTSAESLEDDPEINAANEYRRRMQLKDSNKEILQELEAEAKTAGYTDGYRDGEEKAAVQAQEQNKKILKNLSELAGELETLKKNVLSGVEENFYEVCQALAESLFRREFQINPDAFAQVMKRAVEEAVEDDQVRIKVNPESFKSLAEIGDSELTSKLVEDESVPVGDFKLESSLSVVDGNIRDMIKKLMDQVNLSLFDDNEQNRAS